MDEKIRDALGSLQMPQASADRAWEGLSRRLRPSRRRPVKMALALCAVLVFLMAAGGWTYFTPTAYLSVESASACELHVKSWQMSLPCPLWGMRKRWSSSSLRRRVKLPSQ